MSEPFWIPMGAGSAPLGSVGFGTTFPVSPVNGQEFILVDSVTAPTYAWRFIYVSAKASNKWLFIGGAPIYSEVATSETLSNASYVALATPGPSIVIPVAGDYIVSHGFRLTSNVTTQWLAMSYDIGATAAVDADMTKTVPGTGTGGGNNDTVAMRKRKKSLPAVTLTAKYKCSNSSGFGDRWMSVVPVAVGG